MKLSTAKGTTLVGAGALVGLVALALANGGFQSPQAFAAPPPPAKVKHDKLGPFNVDGKAPKLSQTTLTPQGARGACWPSNTFNYAGAEKDVVTYLKGQDTRDTDHTYKMVVDRDTAWLTAYSDYYHYKPAKTATNASPLEKDVASDVQWHEGLVLKQLTYPITVMDTYCPDGQDNVQQWEVQTLQKGEWVYFLKGHAPGDGTNIIPVRKANCGNFLLPPPPAPKKVITKATPKTPHTVTHRPPAPQPPTKTHKPPTCKINCKPTPPPTCQKPAHMKPGFVWYNCGIHKAPQTQTCMLNNIGCKVPNKAVQSVQSNAGQPIGKTPGASSSAPPPATKGPQPSSGTKAPDPNPSGYDSGSKTGSGTPGGTTCDSSGCSGGGATPGSGSTDTSNSGDNNGTSGSGTSTGGGTIVNPFG